MNSLATGHLGLELIRKVTEATQTGDLRPVGEVADFMLALGLASHNRGQLIATFWFKAALQYRSKDEDIPERYHLLARKLCDEGYCKPYDIEEGICATLFALGIESGGLEASLYDTMVRLLPAASNAESLISSIKRIETDPKSGD